MEEWSNEWKWKTLLVDRLLSDRKCGDTIETTFDIGNPSTKGLITYSEGSKFKEYHGFWKESNLFCPDGNGYMLFADGQVYRGSWVSGVRQGLGQLTFGQHDPPLVSKTLGRPVSCKGHWNEDKIDSKVVIT